MSSAVHVFICDWVLRDVGADLAAHPPERGGALLGLPGRPLVTRYEPDPSAAAAARSWAPSRALAARVQEGFTDFDVAIATPDMMGTVGRLGRILGPQGKMPSPKAGTITFDIAKAVSDIKAGKIEYRTDRTGIIHVAIGKKSFEEHALVENYGAVLDEILRAKPAAAKGRYLRSITLTSTMGPGVKVDTGRTRDLLDETATA